MFSVAALRETETMPDLQAHGPAGASMGYLAPEVPERLTDASLSLRQWG